jgi:hypothetical protein
VGFDPVGPVGPEPFRGVAAQKGRDQGSALDAHGRRNSQRGVAQALKQFLAVFRVPRRANERKINEMGMISALDPKSYETRTVFLSLNWSSFHRPLL